MTRFVPARLLRCAFFAATALLSASASLAQSVGSQGTPFGASQPIPDRYIVVFKNEVTNTRVRADEAVRRVGGRDHHAFSKALKGFAATLSADAVDKLRADPDVDYIEQDRTISLATTIENPATWGLDRIDQVSGLNSQYAYNYTGAGVYAFIIDTGIRGDHTEFTGRVHAGYNTAQHAVGVIDANDTSDCAGHGTHVSGTVGGTTWGVAKGVTLVPVRVLDCAGSGTTSGVIAGIDWVVNSSLRPAVANMSLGGSLSSALNAAVKNAVAQGVTMAVAAGNDNKDACQFSPSSEPSAITVGATTSTDARASFSNFGTCVDVFAPGLSITSAWYTGSSATNVISGTSMATPHVAGVAALALEANPSASPLAVSNFIVANATPNHLTSIGSGSPNLLLYSLAAGAPTEPPPTPIAVSALTGRGARATGGWRAQATITIRNLNTSAGVANVTVSGSFAPGGSGSCVTGSKGSCTITSTTLDKSVPSSVFTIDNATGAGMAYDSSQNSASQITINRR